MKKFFKEISARWQATSPYLFRVIQRISATLTILAGIPELCKQIGYELPSPFNLLASKTIAAAAIVAYLVAKLPVDTKEATKKVLKDIEDNKPE